MVEFLASDGVHTFISENELSMTNSLNCSDNAMWP